MTARSIPIRCVDDKPAREPRDVVGEALRRFVQGQMRPLWHDMTPERKSPWLSAADRFIYTLDELGLSIVPKTGQPR